ncbi:hypothetical protein ACFFQF_12120 [Haladaptatus pallidirubidus]|uniref:Ferritin/DPS protein domain-containing protein n=1 Tax=Haladaptatus pallidirubidus TaxID=1008152 RepID=A0AAV3UEL5_9EURY|nr:hypothetical protein [Haladaptatus pallidirubidus]
MQFYALHQLFDDFAEVLFEHGDGLVERATALGGEARERFEWRPRTHAFRRFEPISSSARSTSRRWRTTCRFTPRTCAEIDAAEAHNDQGTADLLTELSREVDQYLWFLEAHLHREPIQPAGEEPEGRTGGETGRNHGERPQRSRRGTAPTR